MLGLLLMSVCFVWIDELVWLLGATPTIYPYALDYARYIIFGAPVMILAYILNNLLRWQGKANRSVIGLGFGGLLNIVLDPILIFTFDMGISGAAIATHPALVAAVGRCVQKAGGEVLIAESPGGPYTSAAMKAIFRGCGYTDMAREWGFSLYTECRSREVTLPRARAAASSLWRSPFWSGITSSTCAS